MRLHPALAALFLLPLGARAALPFDTLRLHPDNPRYFEWRGRPLIVIGSGEHYGAVLNADFDFRRYLATLGQDRLNHTRLFTGAAYIEPQGAFNIERNTLAPASGRYLAPWMRSDQPGFAGGGNRFDLTRWDEAYFKRLRDFVIEAGRNRVIVEVNLFCPFYGEEQWRLSPFHPANNINGAGTGVARTNVFTLDRHGGLLEPQERFVRKVVDELKDLDAHYYEICNEPYFAGVTLDWQARVAEWIADAQRHHREPKLISQNIANNQARVDALLPNVSVYNFHYATPPDTVQLNAHLQRPIGDNETGFRGTDDAPYRIEAWDFILAGGALFSHLDYSFTVGHEDGTFAYPKSQPGGGNPTLRQQFRILRDFIEAFDFLRMRPANEIILGGVPPSHTARALLQPGRAAALYLRPHLVTRFSARWTGWIEIPEAGETTFHAAANDGIRVWIGNRLLIDQWKEQSETEFSATARLEPGRHQLKVEYFYNGGQAAAKLAWSTPRSPRQPIPASAFRLPDDSGPGLRGEYFADPDLNEAWQSRVDPDLNFAWGTTSPFPAPDASAPVRLQLNLPGDGWQAAWIDPLTGDVLRQTRASRQDDTLVVPAPSFKDDIALRLIWR